MSFTRRGMLYATTVLAVAGPPCVWLLARLPATPAQTVILPIAATVVPIDAVLSREKSKQEDLLVLAQRDPLALARLAQERFQRDVRDYRCVLLKQELIGNELTPVEEVEVRIRAHPQAVYMLWRKNAVQAKRALFRDEPAYVDKQGRKLARVEPAGAVVRLFVKDVLMPIKGPEAEKASRRSIDECGFATSFDLLQQYGDLARKNGVLDVRFAGLGEVDGRPTFVIVRQLPYAGPAGIYPDAKLVLHLDQQWLLPVAIESYADAEGTALLGRYVFTQVELNPGLTDKDFEF